MNSQSSTSDSSSDLYSIPKAGWAAALFGFAPTRAGCFGDIWSDTLLVTTNYAPSINELAKKGSTILALNAGGFSLHDALALRLLRLADLESAIDGLAKAARPSCLLIPTPLAQAFGLKKGSELRGIPVVLTDESAPLPFQSVIVALKVALGQILLMAIPLLVFGLPAMFWGLGTLLGMAVILGLFWNVLIGPGWLRGLMLGLLAALIVGVVLTFGFGLPWIEYIPHLAATMLTGFWLGLLLMGARP